MRVGACKKGPSDEVPRATLRIGRRVILAIQDRSFTMK
jgi:hypothetical protein